MYQLVLLKNGIVVQTWKMKNEQEIKKRLNSYIDKVYIDLMRDGTYKLNNTYTYDVWKISSDNVNNPSHCTQSNSHYFIDVSSFKEIDFYVIARLYGITDPNIQHALKKLLALGKRSGGKSAEQDIQECIDSLNRKLEIDKILDTMGKSN